MGIEPVTVAFTVKLCVAIMPTLLQKNIELIQHPISELIQRLVLLDQRVDVLGEGGGIRVASMKKIKY